MPIYNLIEHSDNYSKTSGSLWQYHKDDSNNNLTDSESLNSKTKDVEIIAPLKFLCNFWRTLEMPLINYEVNLILIWSSTFVITNCTGAGRFEITDIKLYVPIVTFQLKIM